MRRARIKKLIKITVCLVALLIFIAVPYGRAGDYKAPAEGTAAPEITVTALYGGIALRAGQSVKANELFEASGPVKYSVSGSCAKLENGVLTALEPGVATLNAVSTQEPSVTAQIAITVKPLGIAFKYKLLGLSQGETVQLAYSPADTKAEFKVQGDAVQLSGGVVKGISAGVARISAVVDGAEVGCCFAVVTSRAQKTPLAEISPPRFISTGGILKNEDAQGGKTAVIMLTGDIMCLSAQQNAAKINDTFDFSKSFSLVKRYFTLADFVMGNLETALSSSAPYASEQKNVDGKPNCNAPATMLDALKYAGFDALAAANNHALDAGEQGVFETLERFERYGLYGTGIYTDKESQRFILADINGIKVAFLSYTEIMNKRNAVSAERYDEIIGAYSKEAAAADCAAARAAGAEYIIAYIHWGKENTHDVTQRQRNQAQQLADAGADFIAGSHPHCLQAAQSITASDGRSVTCVYSMGNFVSSMGGTINNDTVILRVELERKNGGIVLKSAGYLPCRVGRHDGTRFVIIPCDAFDSDALSAARERIRAVMGEALEQLSS